MKYLTICCDGSGREYYRRVTESTLEIKNYLKVQANMVVQRHLKNANKEAKPRYYQGQEAPVHYKIVDDVVYIYNTWEEQRPFMIIRVSVAPDSEPVTPIGGVDYEINTLNGKRVVFPLKRPDNYPFT